MLNIRGTMHCGIPAFGNQRFTVPSRLFVSRLSHLPRAPHHTNPPSYTLTMSFALAHNRPLEIMHLYFDDKQEVMATCLLATNETVELVSVVSISDRRVILRALAHELLWSVIRTVYFLEVLPSI
ncbi:BQ5605_C008g05204 [Microbotryum silenes-dioicae]|uniref:BQ5605_C008g05204 protein n=1 Tax=Microbotryum silenes-dioicae TaxID=796604 RepID=A0A2X0P7Z8_9BASI|nr:BQ5605_C008g05204 [Microbotryum silenes-dioicae]